MCRGARQGSREQRQKSRCRLSESNWKRSPTGWTPLKKDGFCMEVNFGGGAVTILLVATYAHYTRARGRFDTLIRRKELFLPLLTVALAKGAA